MSGIPNNSVPDHFVDVNKMIDNGRGARDIFRDNMSRSLSKVDRMSKKHGQEV